MNVKILYLKKPIGEYKDVYEVNWEERVDILSVVQDGEWLIFKFDDEPKVEREGDELIITNATPRRIFPIRG